jgi:hypothetical protein
VECALDLGQNRFCSQLLGISASYPALFLAVQLPQARITRQYLQHTVTADLRGLVFQTPREQVPVSWDRVLDYYLDPVEGALQRADRCVVVTARGEYSFLST